MRGSRAVSRHPVVRALIALVVMSIVAACASCAGGSGSESSVRVRALWFGAASDGRVEGGVTPVDITAVTDEPRTPLSLDLRGLRAAGAGPMWTAATSVAAAQAVLVSGVDPRTRQLKYSLQEAIDGPSAGALLTAGTLAAIRGSTIADSTTMTGTVLPDGSVGPVAGVAEKLRAAAVAGFTRVLIPAGMTQVLDRETDRVVDPVELGRSVGIEVKPVTNLPDAYALMTGRPEAPSAPSPPPIDTRILRMLTRRSRTLLASIDGRPQSVPIATWAQAAEGALEQKDPVLAFSAAAEAALATRELEASARLRADANRMPFDDLKARLGDDAQQSFAEIREEMRTIAEFPATKIAQLTGLADTLAWGDFALTSIRVAQQRLQTASTMAELDDIDRFLTVARFETATYMSACAESLRYVGSTPISDVGGTVDRLNAYTELLARAADANRAYAKSIGLGVNDDTYLAQIIQHSDDLTSTREFPRLHRSTARPALRLSVALLEYVETTQLVNQLTADEGGADLPPNLVPIDDPATLLTQAQTADEIAGTQVRSIAAAGLDPSFVQWNSRWGADLAFGHLPDATDEQKLHGLQYQWFAVLQARLLTNLSHLDR